MEGSPQGRVDLPVPQAVDHRAAGGREHRVDDRQQLVEVSGLDAAGAGIHEEGHRVEDAHHHQVGGAGGEGLAPGGGRRHAEHRHPDGRVGGQGYQQRPTEGDDGQEEVHQLGQGNVGAGQVEQRGDVTEEVVEDVGAAVGQAGNARCLDHRDQQPTKPRSPGQAQADLGPHEQRVVQRAADGRVAVTGHGGQEGTLGANEGDK